MRGYGRVSHAGGTPSRGRRRPQPCAAASAASAASAAASAAACSSTASFWPPKARETSLARRGLKASRRRVVRFSTAVAGTCATLSTATVAEDRESVIWVTSSRIWSTRMISRLAASTVSCTRSTRGSTFATAGFTDSVSSLALAMIGCTSCFTSSIVVRALRTVIASSTTNQIKAMPTMMKTTGNAALMISMTTLLFAFLHRLYHAGGRGRSAIRPGGVRAGCGARLAGTGGRLASKGLPAALGGMVEAAALQPFG